MRFDLFAKLKYQSSPIILTAGIKYYIFDVNNFAWPKKVKANYFIVHPKVDQRAGQLSLPHLGIFAIHTRYFLNLIWFI